MRTGGQEPAGVVKIPGTTIRMSSDKGGSWQSLGSDGSTSTYHVDYVIGSGTHASGYFIDLGNHWFQSPVAYYTSLTAYGMAPGFEGEPDPDFTRPVGEGCVFCHAGSFNAVTGTMNASRAAARASAFWPISAYTEGKLPSTILANRGRASAGKDRERIDMP
jgi:hypothetical protein